MDKLPMCECAVFWEEHHPECPVAREVAHLLARRDTLKQICKLLRESLADSEKLQEEYKLDAERYRLLRSMRWETAPLAVVTRPKDSVRLGYDCPNEERLDTMLDTFIQVKEIK